MIISEVTAADPPETIVDNVGNNVRVHLSLPKDVKRAVKSDLPKLAIKRSKLLTELNKLKELTSTEGYKLKASVKTQEGNLNKVKYIKVLIIIISILFFYR